MLLWQGLAGLPQLTLPLVMMEGGPVGLGVIGPRGSDARLLELAARVFPAEEH